jgi:superfamily I DNA/RNA helicase
VVWTRYANEAHRNMGIIETLVDFRDRDLQAAVAIVCRHAQSAERMHRELSMGLDVRLALEGQFRFSPGISVTCVDEVKGLEFDIVVIPDVSPASYPGEVRCRKALYVAATRATHQLWMVTPSAWSSLVVPAVVQAAGVTAGPGRSPGLRDGGRPTPGSQARP